MDGNTITGKIIGCVIEVHRQLGTELLESTCQDCLIYELQQLNLCAQKEVFILLKYKNLKLKRGFKIDALVENSVALELKAVAKITEIHTSQLLTYLKLGKFKLGLLLNFNVKILKQGITKIINEKNSTIPLRISVFLK